MEILDNINKLIKSTWYDQESDTLITYISIGILKEIKEKLKSLDIMTKKHVNLRHLKSIIEIFDDNEKILSIYNNGSRNADGLTMKELIVLKNLLEKTNDES